MRLVDTLEIRNFKSLKHATFSFGQITVFIGPNGTGKSSVMQLLALLKQSVGSGGINLAGPLVNLGPFEEIVFQRNAALDIFIRLAGTYHLSHFLSPIETQEVDYVYEVNFDRSRLRVNLGRMKGGNLAIEGRHYYGAAQASPSEVDYGTKAGLAISGGAQIGQPIAMSVRRFTSATQEDYQRIQEEINELQTVIANVLRSVYFVPASRGLDRRAFPLIESPASDFISEQGTTRQAGDVAGTLAYRRDLEQRISNWSERITGTSVASSMEPGRQASVIARRGKLSLNLVNEGFGSNQLVLLLTQLAAASEGAFIAVEEPEIHLHPRAQARLAEVLAEVAVEEDKQILLTTHSEHILFGLLTKVAEGKIPAGDVKIYNFARVEAETKPTELQVDDKGRVEGGLTGFFEADLEQFQRFLSALGRKDNS